MTTDPARRRLVLITPAGSYRTNGYIAAASELGCDLVVATDAAVAIPGSAICVSLAEPTDAAEAISAQLALPVTGVLGTDGAALPVAAAVAYRLGLRANTLASLAVAADKLLQRESLDRAGVSQPCFALAERTDWSRFPAVLKPRDRSASQGVLRVDSPEELHQLLPEVHSIVGQDAELLIEEFVPGAELVVEGMLRNGVLEVIALFDKPDTPNGPTFPETLLITPARISEVTEAAVVEVAKRACSAIGLSEGPVHIECKCHGDRVWFIELAARTIGGLCSRSLRPGGMSMEEVVLRGALDLPTPSVQHGGASGVLMLPIPERGVLEEVRGVEEARCVAGITDVVIAIGVGEQVLPLPYGDRYLGFVFAEADSPHVVEESLREAWSALEVQISVS